MIFLHQVKRIERQMLAIKLTVRHNKSFPETSQSQRLRDGHPKVKTDLISSQNEAGQVTHLSRLLIEIQCKKAPPPLPSKNVLSFYIFRCCSPGLPAIDSTWRWEKKPTPRDLSCFPIVEIGDQPNQECFHCP